MPLDPQYVIASDLEQYFVDKDTGLPLAAGKLTFYRDVARNVLKPVYQLSGSPPNYTYTALPNPITLSGVGTVQDSGGNNVVVYYKPFDDDGNLDLYYVTCESSGAVQQFTREAWPNTTSLSSSLENAFSVSNQVSNSQFTRTFLNQNAPTVYSVSSAIESVFVCAPNWEFVISGTGSVTVQVIPIAGNDNVITSPPYMLDVNVSSGITECFLRQRLNVNSGLWSSTGTQEIFLSATIVARNENSGTTGLQMFYNESSGGSPVNILDVSFDNSAYVELQGSSLDPIPESTDPTTGQSGYIDLYISFLTGSHVRISSVQVIPVSSNLGPQFLSYEVQSSNREQALMGDYFIPKLEERQVKSLLVGWDFPVNPAQFGTSGNISTTASYIWDQTIALRGSSGNVTFSRDSITGGVSFVTSGTNDAFYIMQYLDGAQAKKIIGNPLSVNVFGYKGVTGNMVTMRVYLFRAPSTSTFPTLPTSIGSLASNGIFAITASGWTEIPRSGLDTASANLSTVTTSDEINSGSNDHGFNGWQITSSSQLSDTDKLAIVVTFAYDIDNITITINSISLIPGDIPCRPSPQTNAESLIDCQYYYESSYSPGVSPATITGIGQLIADQLFVIGTPNHFIPKDFSFTFNSLKRISPSNSNVILYSPLSGSSGNVRGYASNGTTLTSNSDLLVSSLWSIFSTSPKNVTFVSSSNTSGYVIASNTLYTYIAYHYTIDVRLGLT